MKVEEVERVRALLEELGEDALIARLDSFVKLNEGLESKKGEDYVRLSVLSFLEGLLMSLKLKYPENGEIGELYEEVRARRAELDELFRKPAMQNLQ
ncbi:hypothetical protein CL1_1757 [Thermococcus cleftensis]|uniref:DUF3216 domain-containing protein n=1 Tax=Thermococcus cleftensis (strain DSM 27260 / KACC 17922 / CL1) TaxID=163003 RepID=I3ZW69_THECF|nr:MULTISPECIES: DUF3216 domain-containing protein [Thermococcus]AFL95953.1 hypothetical protein CL1_1757 [Thermococcus cleftensis]NJE02745.1 DUF3216 domain-containing protein [Thermococcus sp. MV11]